MSYTDWAPFGTIDLGHPVAYTCGDTRLIVSSTDGHCFLVDLTTRSVAPQRLTSEQEGIFAKLSACRIPPRARRSGARTLLTTATQWPWFYVWTPHDGAASPTHSSTGPVQLVEASPDLSTLAVGIGKQVLGPNEMHAAVAIWKVEWSGNRLRAVQFTGGARKLLGVATYQVVWDPQAAWIAVLTRAKSQDLMYLTLLDARALAILDVIEIPEFSFHARLWTDEVGDALHLATPRGIDRRPLDDLRDSVWRKFATPIQGPFCVDSEKGFVYTNGLAFDDGCRERWRYESLNGCDSLAVVADGLVGVSASGTFRHWQF